MSLRCTSFARCLTSIYLGTKTYTISSFLLPLYNVHSQTIINHQRYASSTRHRPNRSQSSRSSPNKSDGPYRDEDIPARHIHVVSEETGDLGPRITRYSALSSIDRTTHRLLCVSRVPHHLKPGDGEYNYVSQNWERLSENYKRDKTQLSIGEADAFDQDHAEEQDNTSTSQDGQVRLPPILVRTLGFIRLPTGEEWTPICKIENKAEAIAKSRAIEQQRKEQKKLAPEGVKIVELNWAIDVKNDLVYRMKKVEDFLKQKRKVEIVIAPKRRGRKATREECLDLLTKVREVLQTVDGAKETRAMQGDIGGNVSLMMEANRGKKD